MGENLELGALSRCRAEAGEGELLHCPGYGHGDGCTQGPEHAGKTGIKHPKLSLSHRSLRQHMMDAWEQERGRHGKPWVTLCSREDG